MAKLSLGPASHAVKSSRGPSSAPLHFYSTSYSRYHGNRDSGVEEPEGVARRTRGTGYAANFRPALYYSPSLDRVDNPHMISLLADNYTSLTARHYCGFRGPTGAEPFPQSTHTGQSGFSCNLPVTTPTARQVREPYPRGSPSSAPLLHSLRPHDPIAAENSRLGPGMMSTETRTRFTHKTFRDEALHGSSHSYSEDTGFTHAQNIDPITFRPPETFVNDLSPQVTWRPTGSTVMRKDFTAPPQLTGCEGVPLLSGRADRSNGYVKGSNFHSAVQPQAREMVGYTKSSQLQPSPLARARRQDPAHFSTIQQPHPYSSYTHYSMESGRGEQGQGGGQGARGSGQGGGVGKKELTGFSENNQPRVEPHNRDTARFSTHYQAQFLQPALHRPGGGVGAQLTAPNGFSRGTQVHRFQEGGAATSAVLRGLHPSQARLVLHRDPCYNDHTHDAKLHHTA